MLPDASVDTTTTTTTQAPTTTTTTMLGGRIFLIVGDQPTAAPLVGVGQTVGMTVQIQPPAPANGLVVMLSSDDPSVATVPPSLTIAEGQASGEASVTAVGAAGTMTTLRASAPGYTQDALTVVHVTNNVIRLFQRQPVVVGKDLQVAVEGSGGSALSPPAPADLEVTITSADPERLLLSAGIEAEGSESITLPVGAGQSSVPEYFVQSLADRDSVQVTATAPGYAPGSGAVNLVPSGFVFAISAGCGISCSTWCVQENGFTTTIDSVNVPLRVMATSLDPTTLQPPREIWGLGVLSVRPPLTVHVPVTSNPPEVGTIVESPAVFGPGISSVGLACANLSGPGFSRAPVDFDPMAVGTADLTVGVPEGFSTPATGQQITATVE
jgi:hypothetical protein